MLLVIFGREGGDGSDKRGWMWLARNPSMATAMEQGFSRIHCDRVGRKRFFLFYLEICDPWLFSIFFKLTQIWSVLTLF